jgi:hypothetical protein
LFRQCTLKPFKPWAPLALGLFFMSQPPIQQPPRISAVDHDHLEPVELRSVDHAAWESPSTTQASAARRHPHSVFHDLQRCRPARCPVASTFEREAELFRLFAFWRMPRNLFPLPLSHVGAPSEPNNQEAKDRRKSLEVTLKHLDELVSFSKVFV